MAIEYDPFSEEVRNDPLPIYERLREEDPVHYMKKYDAWALARFQDIWDASSNDDLIASRGTTPAQLLTRDQPVTLEMVGQTSGSSDIPIRARVEGFLGCRDDVRADGEAFKTFHILAERADHDE